MRKHICAPCVSLCEPYDSTIPMQLVLLLFPVRGYVVPQRHIFVSNVLSPVIAFAVTQNLYSMFFEKDCVFGHLLWGFFYQWGSGMLLWILWRPTATVTVYKETVSVAVIGGGLVRYRRIFCRKCQQSWTMQSQGVWLQPLTMGLSKKWNKNCHVGKCFILIKQTQHFFTVLAFEKD